MWLLSAEQAARLVALQRSRDLQRLGAALDSTFPELRGRLGARWNDFIEHGARRATAYGLDHLLCVARLLAAWVVCGADFEARQAWAAAILTDAQRSEGAKAFQLCVRILEQLRTAAQSGQPTAADFELALRRLDEGLSGAGAFASLLPRERIRLGVACDVDAVELRLVDASWRQHYTAHGGTWRREPSAGAAASITLVHDPVAATAPLWPRQVTLLSLAPGAERAARLRVRVKAEHRCDAALHPLLQCLEPAGERALRGDVAADATLAVHAPPATDPGAQPHVGEEDAPQFSVLNVASCGLRERGVPIGSLSTLLAAYDATQHLVAS